MKKLQEFTRPQSSSVGKPNQDKFAKFLDYCREVRIQTDAKKRRARAIAARKFNRSHKKAARK